MSLTPTHTPRHAVGRLPAAVLDVDVAEPLPSVSPLADGRRVERVWLLVRAFTEPLGHLMLDVPDAGLTPYMIATAIDRRFGPQIRDRIDAAGGDVTAGIPVVGVTAETTPPYLATRAEVLSDAPRITVVVCTRDRPDRLSACLDSILAQRYFRYRVLVVDNAPSSHETEHVVREYARRAPVDYLREPRPGLSCARNAAVAAAPGEILAWIDDDVVADPFWLAEVARALTEHPDTDIVSGMIVPAELETDVQVWFEQFGGHSKGRGFTAAVFSPRTAREQNPLYPLPAFGTGANMIFRPGVIERFGGFDEALGAGTPAMGSEDTLAFMQVLNAGGTVAYQPTALVRHYHRRDLVGLHKQMVGYGTGLTAAYTSLVLSNPRVIFRLLRLIPTALRDVLGSHGVRSEGLREDFPRELLAANRSGMLRGPWLYLRGRRTNRKAARTNQKRTHRAHPRVTSHRRRPS
jgi:glycosyltransferase involved in cell wall biosynthesis